MWKRWIRLLTPPAPWRQRLRRFAMASLAVAFVASIGWWLIDLRLAAVARRHADAGLSQPIDAIRRDWTEVILPTALGSEGDAAQRAREVASARIDLAVTDATGGRTTALKQTVRAVLQGVREADTPPTEEGVQWAEWLVRRLTESLALLEQRERIALLIEADDTLATLANRTRRRASAPSVAEEIEPPAESPALAVTPKPASPPQAEPVPEPDPEAPTVEQPPRPLVVKAVPAAQQPETPATREPRAWSPDWRTGESESLGPDADERPAPRTLAESTDRELLAEYMSLSDDLRETSASGPTSARGSSLQTEAEVRLEAIGGELASRGFRSVDRRHVETLLSPHAARRVALAERLLTTQTGDTARLLLVLAADESAEVRAAAISALGSSASRPLVRVAWELASQDSDPRVGRLAEPLRRRLR